MEETKYTWEINADGIYCKELDVQIKNSSENSFPFYATSDYGIIYGEQGSSHAISVEGRESICQMKAIRMFNEYGDNIKDIFPNISFNNSISRFEAMKQCAKEIEKNIFVEGRCYDLNKQYGQTVFLYWQEIDFEEKMLIEESICKEKGFDINSIAEAKAPISTPDSIVVDGHVMGYRNGKAYPFIVLDNGGGQIKIKYGNPGEVHALITSRIKKELTAKVYEKLVNVPEEKRGIMAQKNAERLINEKAIIEGRYWDLRESDDKVIFSFWDKYKSCKEEDIIKKICEERGIDFEDAYTYKFNTLLKVSNMDDYKPTDADYSGLEGQNDDFDLEKYYNDTKNKIRQIHNPEFVPGEKEDRIEFEKRKKDATSDFRNSRDSKNDEKLKYEKPRNGYPNMTDAEYRFRTSMDESEKSF